MGDHEPVEIELTANQVERLHEIREASTEGGHLPPISLQSAITVALDTYDAVEGGLYHEEYTRNKKLKGLLENWEDEIDRGMHPAWEVATMKCMDELERAIDEEND